MRIAGHTYVFGADVRDAGAMDRILGSMAAIGYGAVEIMEPLGELPGLIRKHDLRMAALHVVMPKVLEVERLTDYLASCDCNDVCSSGLMDWNVRTPEAYREGVRVLNERGRALRERGIRVHYHNHEFEFDEVAGGTRGIDILLDGIDTRCVDLCFDMGWTWYAGVDAARFAADHAQAVGVVHLRDFAGRTSTRLGGGDVPVAEHLATARALPGLRWLVVEQDPGCDDPVDDMRSSMEFLTRH